MKREELVSLARECQMPHLYQIGDDLELERLERFAALVAAAENEACEIAIEELPPDADRSDCAAAIRARGQA